ncbi:MAG: outer membrane beta-barrel protein [Hyphomonadaceae bacterium]
MSGADGLRAVMMGVVSPGLAVIAAGAASAQQAAVEAVSPEAVQQGVSVFEAAYFDNFNPVNAEDMVARVPGFVIDDGDDRRGFGATAGNVLINGERPSSKTAVSDQLKRIPASSVARLELISGNASDLDVRGQAQLVNVVLKRASRSGAPGTWVLAARHIQFSDRIGYTAQASKSFALGEKAELSLDLQFPNLRGRSESTESHRLADGAIIESRDSYGQPNYIGVAGAASLKWRPGASDTVNINAQFRPTWDTVGNGRRIYAADGDLVQVLAGRSEQDNKYSAEIGGDWEHTFGKSLSVKLLALASSSGYDQTQVYEIYAPATLVRTQTLDSTMESGERVGRGVFTWNAHPDHTLEFGAEGAFNFSDTTLDVFIQSPGGPLVPVPLAVSDARVEELRGEVFFTDIWSASDAFTLETGLTFEASRITQTGDESKEREFTYPKPRISATWMPNAGDQVRVSVERDISQLDFSEFASSLNVLDATSIIGNPDLEPEKAWKGRVEWDRRMGKLGAFTVAAFHDEVEDVHDLVVRQALDGSNQLVYVDAFGNIGDGTRTGVEVKGSAPLDRFGIPHAELRVNGILQETRVTDPQTGEERSFSYSTERASGSSATLNTGTTRWAYLISYRQDLPGLKSAWGGSVSNWSGREEFRRAELYEYERETERLDLFFETTAIPGLTTRFSVSNIFASDEQRTRTVYAGDPLTTPSPRAGGVIDRIERRKTKGGPEGTRTFGVQISGKF